MKLLVTILTISLFSFSCEKREIVVLKERVTDISRQRDSLERLLSLTRAFYSRNEGLTDVRYYISGDEKRLKAMGIITRVSGLSREFKISNTVSERHFICIDAQATDSINISGKHIRILGCFNPKYYQISGRDEDVFHTLVIKDKAKFWAHNKFLIITYK